MKNGSIREFLQQKAVKTGAVVLASALVLTSSSWSGIFRNEPEFTAEAELPIYIEPADSVISPEPVPGPPAPKVTKKTKTNKTTKKVKLKQKSKKTYTKKSKGKKQTTTSRQVTSEATTTVKTETTTSLTSKFKKGSNINTQTTTVKTVTTTTVQANNPAGGNSVVSSTVQASSQNASAGPVQIGAAAPRVDSRVARAYTTLGFTINVDRKSKQQKHHPEKKRRHRVSRAGTLPGVHRGQR